MGKASKDLPIVDSVGRLITHFEPGVRYRVSNHGYYSLALRPGEEQEILPVLPVQRMVYEHRLAKARVYRRKKLSS